MREVAHQQLPGDGLDELIDVADPIGRIACGPLGQSHPVDHGHVDIHQLKALIAVLGAGDDVAALKGVIIGPEPIRALRGAALGGRGTSGPDAGGLAGLLPPGQHELNGQQMHHTDLNQAHRAQWPGQMHMHTGAKDGHRHPESLVDAALIDAKGAHTRDGPTQ